MVDMCIKLPYDHNHLGPCKYTRIIYLENTLT
jgi:hypothetical protein